MGVPMSYILRHSDVTFLTKVSSMIWMTRTFSELCKHVSLTKVFLVIQTSQNCMQSEPCNHHLNNQSILGHAADMKLHATEICKCISQQSKHSWYYRWPEMLCDLTLVHVVPW